MKNPSPLKKIFLFPIEKFAENFCLVLIGNKTDLEAERQVAEKAARDLADSLGIKYFETSAKTGENVNEAIDALLEQVGVYNFRKHFSLTCKVLTLFL